MENVVTLHFCQHFINELSAMNNIIAIVLEALAGLSKNTVLVVLLLNAQPTHWDLLALLLEISQVKTVFYLS